MNLKTSAYRVQPTPFEKIITLPTSKSYANRLLIIGSLIGNGFTIHHVPKSTDVTHMVDVLRSIGILIEVFDDTIKILNSFPHCETEIDHPITLKSGDGGTTNRFLAAFLSRGKRTYRLEMSERMSSRPFDVLINILGKSGVAVKRDDRHLEIKGPIYPESSIQVDGSLSSQFGSALILALYDLGVNVQVNALEGSSLYIELSREIARAVLSGKREFTVPVDWSCASYPMALAAVSGTVRIKDAAKVDLFQADSIFVKVLHEMGASLTIIENDLIVSKGDLQALELDCREFPDLVPSLAFVCAHARGISKISGLKNLQFKESNRIVEILKILELFDVIYSYNNETHTLLIEGSEKSVKSKDYQAPSDHRMIMLAYLFMKSNLGGTISNHDHVNKSFPNFLNLMS